MANQEIVKFATNIEDIINELTDEEVLSLANTISGGLLKNKLNSRQDSLKVILNYSEDIPSLLRRKVFTRDKLLSYLYDKNVAIKLPVTKHEIIDRILRLWNDEIDSSQANKEILSNNLDDSSVGSSQSTNDESAFNTNKHEQIIASTSEVSRSEIVEKSESNDEIAVQNTVKLLAEQFSDWFYKLLNKNELSPEHFFPDVVLNLTLTLNGDTNTTNLCNDPEAVTETLKSVKDQYNLFFNPNLIGDSLKSQMDSHGLVMIIVGGTLHINSVCVGVFEQLFALARDPFAENNWKVKRTDLKLKNGANNAGPSRLENNVTGNSDMYCLDAAK